MQGSPFLLLTPFGCWSVPRLTITVLTMTSELKAALPPELASSLTVAFSAHLTLLPPLLPCGSLFYTGVSAVVYGTARLNAGLPSAPGTGHWIVSSAGRGCFWSCLTTLDLSSRALANSVQYINPALLVNL